MDRSHLGSVREENGGTGGHVRGAVQLDQHRVDQLQLSLHPVPVSRASQTVHVLQRPTLGRVAAHFLNVSSLHDPVLAQSQLLRQQLQPVPDSAVHSALLPVRRVCEDTVRTVQKQTRRRISEGGETEVVQETRTAQGIRLAGSDVLHHVQPQLFRVLLRALRQKGQFQQCAQPRRVRGLSGSVCVYVLQVRCRS